MSENTGLTAGRLVAVLVIAAASVVFGADEPTPTQTPRPAGEKTLSEIAKDTQLKGQDKGKGIVITNENLSSYAEKGKVTEVESKSENKGLRPLHASGANTPVAVVPQTVAGPEDERRQYWRGQYTRQLELVASLEQQLKDLDYQIPGLWRDFYAWDDPAYRDGVIKPKLDAALEQRKKTETDLETARARLGEIKQEARKDGAQPGWFRDLDVAAPPATTPTPAVNVVY